VLTRELAAPQPLEVCMFFGCFKVVIWRLVHSYRKQNQSCDSKIWAGLCLCFAHLCCVCISKVYAEKIARGWCTPQRIG